MEIILHLYSTSMNMLEPLNNMHNIMRYPGEQNRKQKTKGTMEIEYSKRSLARVGLVVVTPWFYLLHKYCYSIIFHCGTIVIK